MAAKGNDSPNIEKGLILAAIGKSHEVQLVKGIKLELKGGDKIDSRILVVTSFRFYILTANKAPYKVDLSVHILDIHAIESKKQDQIVIQYGEKHVKFSLTKPGSTHIVLGQLIANLKINFPGGNLDELIKKDIEPGDKLDNINNAVNKLTSSESLNEAGPCGGFSHSYSCICNHMGVPFLEEVAWDVDTIYLSNDTKEFNIQDFDHLEPRELIPILTTLQYNAWFTRLVCVSYKLSAEILDVITKVIKRSTTIEEVVLDGVSLGREFCQKLANALTSNPKSALERIDLSRNPSAEDRGIIHMVGSFSKISHGLSSLVLHETGITNKAAASFGQMLNNSKYMSTSLTRLDLSSNPIKADGVTAICDFLAQANALTHLNLSSTECFVENIFGALIRGSCQNLSHLNLSGNQFTNRKSKDTNLPSSYQQFFSSTAALNEIKLSECRLPADAVRALFLGLIENSVVKEVIVDISKNELKSAGLRAMTGPLSQISNLYSLDLTDNGFESDMIPLCESLCENKAVKKLYLGQNCHKGRNLNNIMEGLIKLISVENSPIEYLNLSESRLKQSITLLFDSLGTNESLVELDISGNIMGDEGARVLAKALQINSKLRTIHLDRNNVTQSGFRDIALALENNLTLQSMPIPLNDVSLCLKPATEKALKQIEKCLSRNHSPSKAVTEQAYRLQQGLMMTSTQQQMVDKLIVQLQDTARILRNSPDETVQSGLRNALQCINDADKLKQLFLKFHMETSSKNMEERLSSLASDIYHSIEQQVQENKDKILKSAEKYCPFVTEQQSVKDNLKTACEGKANVSKAFIDTVLLQQLGPVILNEVSEKNLNLSTIVVDTLMDEVISQLENQQAILDILVKEHQTKVAPVEEKPTETEEPNDNIISEAAQKAKNRLSAVNNRRSVRFPDDESEVFNAHSHPRRRPTINRKRRTSEITEEHSDGSVVKGDSKKKGPAVADIDLSVSSETATNELVHVTKNRPRPARGRRPPTRAVGGQQNAAVGPEIVDDNFDAGIDSFFNKPAARPQSAALPPTVNVVPDPSLHKSATIGQRSSGSKKKHEKEEAEDSAKDQPEKKVKRHVKTQKSSSKTSTGLFKKKNEKKSPNISRKEAKKDHKKSQEDLTDAGPAPQKKQEPKHAESSPKPEKPVDKPEKPVDKPEKPAAKADKQPKKPPQRPQRPEKQVPNEVEKPTEPEMKPVVVTTEPVDEPSKEIKAEDNKDHEEDKEDGGKQDGGKQDDGKQEEGKKKEEKKEEEKKEEEKKEEEKKEGEEEGKQEGEKQERGEPEGVDSTKVEEEQKPKPQPKAPPKFGVGLPMGVVGGDLLAEMKKRNQRNNSEKKPSPEPKPRQRVGTNPEVARPTVPVRPSSMKRSVKSKSAAELISVPQDSKEERRMSNEASKPAPPKPAPKGKPQVAARTAKPSVPKRPPSINKEKRKSLDAEKRKSLEAETAAEKAPETKPKDETPVKQDEAIEATQTIDKKPENEVVNGQTEKVHEAPKKELDDKPGAKEDPQKLEDEKAPEVKEKPEDSTPADIDDTPEKDTSQTPEKGTSEEEATGTKTESKEVPKDSSSDASESMNENEASMETNPEPTISEGDQKTGENEVPDKPKDTNDNETDVTNAVSEKTTEKVEPAATDAESDDVIKSPVDKDTLEEALSAKNTSF